MALILINSALFILGILILIRSSIFVVRSLVVLARFFGVSEFAVSFLLMAFATTLPDLAVSIDSAIYGTPEIALGNVLGANIVTMSLILGLVTIISGKISLEDHKVLRAHRLFDLFLIIFPIFLMIDGKLSRIDGSVLLFLFIANLIILFKVKKHFKHHLIFNHFGDSFGEVISSIKHTFKNIIIFIVAVLFLVGGSYFVVYSANNLSLEFGLPEILIGIFVISLGTSLPELVFGVRSALSGKGSLSLGNLFGASVFNATFILGVTSIINPIIVTAPKEFWIASIFMALIMFSAFHFLKSKSFLVRKEGIILLSIYILFLIVQIGIGGV